MGWRSFSESGADSSWWFEVWMKGWDSTVCFGASVSVRIVDDCPWEVYEGKLFYCLGRCRLEIFTRRFQPIAEADCVILFVVCKMTSGSLKTLSSSLQGN